ncbi:hypothetical protein [Nonomuraea helvata]|uniref:Uncharacterized protein n=1 Tax=Nonomuraea helvata TaxID=37484 RepID=A0ABV5RRP0_9ACTN
MKLLESYVVISDLIFRPITGPEEMNLFNALPGPYNDSLAEDLRNGRCRAEWMWMALRDGRPVARVGWWSRSGTRPEVLETLDIDDTCDDPLRIDVGECLLRTALAELFPEGTRSHMEVKIVNPDHVFVEA